MKKSTHYHHLIAMDWHTYCKITGKLKIIFSRLSFIYKVPWCMVKHKWLGLQPIMSIFMKVQPISLSTLITKWRLWLIIIYMPPYSKAAAIGLEMMWTPITIPWKHMGIGGIHSCILNLGIRYRQVVNFVIWPIYPQEREPVTHWLEDECTSESFWMLRRKGPEFLGH